ncbi:MAG: nucleotidyltransferase domain-containing protein [Methanosarcinales archaeon]|nr:nucleotidyltransferase domain-containing protein [Methanosarcinales archaeon]
MDNNIKNDLRLLADYDVVIFGSYIKNNTNQRSDIDVAVITKNSGRDENIAIWSELIGKAPEIYDIKIFELLPIQIKASVMDNYEVAYGNMVDISEYFYGFRKMWNDVRYRIEENQFKNAREKMALIEQHKIAVKMRKINVAP